MADGTARSSGGGNARITSHNQGFSLIEVFNNLALWGENKFVSELKRTYKFQRGVNNKLDCHANQTRILSKEYSFVAGDYVRSTARNDVKRHTEDNSPKYRMVGKIYHCLTNVDKRLRNKCAMTWNSDMEENNFTDKVFSRFTSHFSLKSAAFTLAEVLITLGIIGVVAAMTMPSLITNYQKKQTVTQLKKAYTELSQVIKSAEQENGMIETWDVSSMLKGQEGADRFANEFLIPYIKVIKKCFPSTSECWADDVYNLNGVKYSYLGNRAEFNSFVTVSGYSVYYWLNGDGTGGWLWVDLNGPRKPNIIGKDVFALTMRWVPDSNQNGPVTCERRLGVSMIGATCKSETSPRDGLISGNFTNGVSDYKCKKGVGGSIAGVYCGALIMLDGWEIKSDYPW